MPGRSLSFFIANSFCTSYSIAISYLVSLAFDLDDFAEVARPDGPKLSVKVDLRHLSLYKI